MHSSSSSESLSSENINPIPPSLLNRPTRITSAHKRMLSRAHSFSGGSTSESSLSSTATVGSTSKRHGPLGPGRKTKIICTIGPKTQSVDMLGKLVDAGMDVMRMNFSHGTREFHGLTIKNLRTALARRQEVKSVGILLDTKGPEIRTGKLVGGKDVFLKENQQFTFYVDQSHVGDEHGVAMSYEDLPNSVGIGSAILVDDGLISMTVIDVTSEAVICRVDNAGVLGETKGVNLPNIKVNLPAITEKDRLDIEFGVEQHVDFIAASFVRKPGDVLEIQKILGNSGIKIISKIENQEGLDNFDAILEVSDGIMVARGDLGVEIPVEKVAHEQKEMIKKCNLAGKPVITATQMLESMIVNPRPTRAETTDIVNAVLDGSDAVMLSGETAKGSYPVAAVRIMGKICIEAEADIDYLGVYQNMRRKLKLPIPVTQAISSAAVKISWDLNSPLIIALTSSGSTAQSVAKFRPKCPVIAVTSSAQAARQIQLCRGIVPMLVDSMAGTENLIAQAMFRGVRSGYAKQGDDIVLVSGCIENVAGSTNLMKIYKCLGFVV